MNTITSRLLSGGFLRMLSVIIVSVISLFTMPLLIHNLGNEQYSLWSLCSTFVGYAVIIDFGFTRAFNQNFSQRFGENHTIAELSSIVSTAFVIFLILGCLTMVIGAIISATHCLLVDDEHTKTFIQTILILTMTYAIQYPFRLCSGLLYVKVRHDILVLGHIIETLVRMSLIVLAVLHGYGIVAMALITMFTSLSQYLWEFFWTYRQFHGIRIRSRYVSISVFKKMFSYSVPSFISDVSLYLQTQSLPPLVSKWISLDSVVFLSVSQRLMAYTYQIVNSWSGMLAPVFGQVMHKGDQSERMLTVMTHVITIGAYWISINLLIFGKPFIEVWLGPSYCMSYYLLVWLIFGSFIAFVMMPAKELLLGHAIHGGLAGIHLSELFQVILYSYLLHEAFGLVGVGIGFALALIPTELIAIPLMLHKNQISISKIFLPILKVFPVLLLTGILLYANMYQEPIDTAFSLIFWIALVNITLLPVIIWAMPIEVQSILTSKLRKYYA